MIFRFSDDISVVRWHLERWDLLAFDIRVILTELVFVTANAHTEGVHNHVARIPELGLDGARCLIPCKPGVRFGMSWGLELGCHNSIIRCQGKGKRQCLEYLVCQILSMAELH